MILKAFGYREVEAAGIFFGLSVYASCSASDKWGYAPLFYTFKVILVVVTHKVNTDAGPFPLPPKLQ